jgi:hypothetical protein
MKPHHVAGIPSFEPASALKQNELWNWEKPPRSTYSFSKFDFLLQLYIREDRNEDRFRALQKQRTFFRKLIPDTSPAASARNFERNEALRKRNGRRRYSPMSWEEASDVQPVFPLDNPS